MKFKRSEEASSSIMEKDGIWKRVWHACLPPKVRNFVWRALNDVVAVGENLVKRQIPRTLSVLGIGEFPESVDHLLFCCKES